MGLSGAAKKQRIQDDPRNLRWAQDTSAPGFRLLASMGWDPTSNPSLGNIDSQAAITANGGSSFSKKISSIPIAKEDNLGIGMKRGSAANVVGTLKAMGVGSGSNAVQKVSGFVTAGSGSNTPNGGSGSSQGGEFGGLLARLNKMKEMGSLNATPVASDSEGTKKRKRSGSTSTSSSSSSEEDDSDDDSSSDDSSDSDSEPVASTSAPAPPPPAPVLSSYAQAVLNNPRMASRSKHLRAKRMATSSNAAAMAEILGLAPTPSPSTSGTSTPALAIAPPSKEGWPVVPSKGTSAMVQTTTITTTTTTTSSGGETEKEKKKREKFEKKARKESKALKKAAKFEEKKESKVKRLPSPPPPPPAAGVEKRTRSPSPEFKVHSAQHDPFHVTSETPTVDEGPAKKASGIYSSMFVSSKQGGMGATWVPPTKEGEKGKLVEQGEEAGKKVEGEVKEGEVTGEKKSKKDKKDRKEKKGKSEKTKDEKTKSKKRKAEETVDVEEKSEVKETQEEKRARKEAKRAKKEAKKARQEK